LKDQLAVFSSTLTPSSQGAGAVPTPVFDPSSLQEKIAKLQSQIGERDAQATALSSKIAALQKSLDDQRAAQTEVSKKTETAVTAVQETTRAYETLKQSVDQKISKLYQAGGDNRIRAAALSLSLRQLSDAVKGTSPFTREVDALGSLLGDNPLLAEMKPYAASGVADLALLKSEFAKVKPAPDPQKPATPEGSLLEKIVSNAKSVVRIRKVGEGGAAPQDPLVGVKQALERGDLQAVLKSSEKIAPDVKEKYQSWLKEVNARASLNGLYTKLQNEILSEIGKSTKQKSAPKNKSVPQAPAEPEKPLAREDAQ
jgi:hypothetical protein